MWAWLLHGFWGVGDFSITLEIAQGGVAASHSHSPRGQEAPVLEPWLGPDHLPCLPPSSADPDPHGRNTFTA